MFRNILEWIKCVTERHIYNLFLFNKILGIFPLIVNSYAHFVDVNSYRKILDMNFTGIFFIWTHFFHFIFSLLRLTYTDLNIYSEFYCKTYPKFSTPTHFCNCSLRFKSFNSKNFLSISLSFAGSSVWFYTEIILLSNLLHFKDGT